MRLVRADVQIRADALILGAGPAGAVAALNLAPMRRVVLADRRAHPSPRVGEALPPAARRLLGDMGLLADFVTQGHAPCYGNRAVWGGGEVRETDFLRDPEGHGWHLDRARFDGWLRRMAVARGALLLAPARLMAVHRAEAGWQIQLASERGICRSEGGAGHRRRRPDPPPLARRLGARREVLDRLVCGWACGRVLASGRGAGLTTVEAVENGWWYTAPTPRRAAGAGVSDRQQICRPHGSPMTMPGSPAMPPRRPRSPRSSPKAGSSLPAAALPRPMARCSTPAPELVGSPRATPA